MALQLEEIASGALALSPDDRLVLVTRIWDSLSTEDLEDEEALAIAERRAAEFDAGLDVAVSYEEVKAEVKQVLDEFRSSPRGKT
jgi:putative addiction module component (TIGR02574 family)